jgi:hypothetical protein
MHILLNSLYLKFGIFYMPSEKPNINKNRKCNILLIPNLFITQCCLPDYTALNERGTDEEWLGNPLKRLWHD